MAQYIRRNQAVGALIDNTNIVGRDLEDAVNAICDIPAADVQPVRHGRWEEDCSGAAICSVCNEYAFETNTHHLCGWFPPYCPNCGAKMDLTNN